MTTVARWIHGGYICNALWVNGFVCVKSGNSLRWSHAYEWRARGHESHRKTDKTDRHTGRRKGGRGGGSGTKRLQTVVGFGAASPILSFLIHAVRWGATLPDEDKSRAQHRQINTEHTERRRAQCLESGSLRWKEGGKKGELSCGGFNGKKCVLFIDHSE